jgi:cyclohexanecarboxylate-CoA ligase
VPAGQAPSLDELNDYLAATGVTHRFWPQSVEVVDALPRTVTGKVRKVDLRQRFGADGGR